MNNIIQKKKEMSSSYFAEIQPIVQNRLKPILFILVIAFFISTIIESWVAITSIQNDTLAIWQQKKWVNSLIMFLTSLGMGYAYYQLKKNNIRQAINFLVFTLTISIISLAFTDGGMGEPPLIIFPLLIMAAGFFGNVSIMGTIKWLCAISIIIMYFLSVYGFQPIGAKMSNSSSGFMRLDQMFYCLLIIEIGYQAVKMFVKDYGTILSRLTSEQKSLDFMANHDKLTGLPNRYSCESHFKKLFRNTNSNDLKSNLLLFIDVDDFKNINTRFGHNGGDEALIKIAENLQQAFSGDDKIVSRIGGDEFIVMLRMSLKEAELCLNNAMKLLAKPLTIYGQTEYVSCSMGVVEVISATSDFKEEYRKADLAMNRAKKTGKNRYCYFEQSINDTELKNIEIGVALHDAVKNKEFTLYYQPQVDLESGEIVGAEALIRWIRESGKVIPPNDFIPIAEKNGSIVEMTYWVIRQSCLDCARWHEEGYNDMFVSVNVPSIVLSNGNLPQILKRECKFAGLDPKYLELELTESIILENGDDVQLQLNEIREMGVSLAIDDFGTGYSNLSYLSRLNVQKLKVDQYFVMNLAKSDQDRTIVEAVAHIAKSFGMKTVAEGVEESELIKPLLDLNCTIGQGYFWSRPEPFELFMKLLGNHNNSRVII